MGFGTHPHQNMEIISIPLKGALSHQDNMGNKRFIWICWRRGIFFNNGFNSSIVLENEQWCRWIHYFVYSASYFDL